MFKRNKKQITVEETSNIIQFDDMGYPLLLCIMSNGDYRWIDVDEKWAEDGVLKGTLEILEWNRRADK